MKLRPVQHLAGLWAGLRLTMNYKSMNGTVNAQLAKLHPDLMVARVGRWNKWRDLETTENIRFTQRFL